MPAFVLALLVAGAVIHAGAQTSLRTIDGQVVNSSALPKVRIEIDPAFRYIGRMPFTIRTIAGGERIVFAEAQGKIIRRMVVLQFEGFLPGVEEIYRYDFSRAREMGGLRWRDNAWVYSQAAQAAAGGNEGTQMHRWLAEQGYQTPDVQLMYRFLTLGDERRKDELIIFYLEGSDDASWIGKSDAESAEWQAQARALERRALAAFRVVP